MVDPVDSDATLDPRTARRAAPTARVLRLLYDGGALRPSSWSRRLDAGSLQVGRQVEGDDALCLAEDRRASRLHATFHADAGGVRLVDASKNGTFVNGERVKERVLEDGDVVRVGDSFLLLRHEPLRMDDEPLPGLLGGSPAMRTLRSSIKLMGPTRATVLLLGESGAGKEVAARALHAASGRKGPFIAVNCAAIPETLAESELFGHVAGAFTGARTAHAGVFRAAEGGTLLLDELGELSAALQPKLLRALEERKVTPVGSTMPVPIDVRVVAATNRPLLQAVKSGGFRGDLYARLAEVVLRVPPLRDRKEDILPILLSHLPEDGPPLSPDLAERLLLYSWPFNVREVVKVAGELSILGRGQPFLELEMVADRLSELDDDEAAEASEPASQGGASKAAAREKGPPRPAPTREELEALLVEHQGKVLRIAAATGRSRKQVYRWLEQHGLDADRYRGPE